MKQNRAKEKEKIRTKERKITEMMRILPKEERKRMEMEVRRKEGEILKEIEENM